MGNSLVAELCASCDAAPDNDLASEGNGPVVTGIVVRVDGDGIVLNPAEGRGEQLN